MSLQLTEETQSTKAPDCLFLAGQEAAVSTEQRLRAELDAAAASAADARAEAAAAGGAAAAAASEAEERRCQLAAVMDTLAALQVR